MADVTRPPSPAPTGLSLSREGNAIKAVWGNPVDGQWETNPARWDHLDEDWTFNASRNMSSTVIQSREGGRHVTGDRIWVRDAGLHSESTVPYNRDKYHPVTNGRYLNSVKADIYAENIRGKAHIVGTYTFQTPRAPEIGDITESDGVFSCEITTDEGKDARERYDTMWCVTRQDSPNRGSYRTETVINGWKASTETKFTAESVDIGDVSVTQPGEWVRITFKAYARGLKGNSATVSKTYVISQPAVSAIKRISVSSLDSSGVVTVYINTNASGNAPVDKVQLQKLDNTPLATPSAASQASGWSDVSGAEDDGTCSGLVDEVGQLPERGNHRWYRIKSTRGASAARYSAPVEATQLYRTGYIVDEGALQIASCLPGDDGTSAIVTMGWDDDDTIGTEVSWSQNEDAWRSSEQPTTHDVTWEDDVSQVSGKPNSAVFVVRGLEEGQDYYVKARRYMDNGNYRDYGPYATPPSEQYPVKPVTRPTDVRLDAPEYVERGRDVELSWTFGGTSMQTAWTVYRVDDYEGADVRVVVAAGEDASGSAVIPAEKLPPTASVRLIVAVTTGGEWSESEASEVRFADAPVLLAVTDGRLMAQPMQLYARCSSPNAALVVKVTSRGVYGSLPDGEIEQVEGDCVWSERVEPEWAFTDDMYYTVVTAPKGVEFYDLATYDLVVQAVDTETGMRSEESTCEFSVGWLHQAIRPGADTEITVDPENLTATITPTKPGNWADGDVFDLYRLTADGPYKIADGVQFGASVTDRFAPYGHVDSLAYRVATRTPDGDVDWGDVPYVLQGKDLRVDWGDGDYVSLPYNVGMQDSYSKSFEEREHLDGSRAGYWNAGRSRGASLSSEMVRLKDWSQADLLRQLGSYPGPAFVRTADGCAYQANVDVDGIESSYGSAVMSASLKATEVQLTSDFMVASSDVSFPEGEEPQPDESLPERQQILMWGGDAPQASMQFTLYEEPHGNVVVTLQTNFDEYMEAWTVPATNVGTAVTLSEFGADLTAYIQMVSNTQSPQFLLKAHYDIEGA